MRSAPPPTPTPRPTRHSPKTRPTTSPHSSPPTGTTRQPPNNTAAPRCDLGAAPVPATSAGTGTVTHLKGETSAMSPITPTPEERIKALEELTAVYGETLDALRNRVYALEHDTPQARRLQYEADIAAADAAEWEPTIGGWDT